MKRTTSKPSRRTKRARSFVFSPEECGHGRARSGSCGCGLQCFIDCPDCGEWWTLHFPAEVIQRSGNPEPTKKQCGSCFRILPSSGTKCAFNIDAHAPDGLRTLCRRCDKRRPFKVIRISMAPGDDWKSRVLSAVAISRTTHGVSVPEHQRSDTPCAVETPQRKGRRSLCKKCFGLPHRVVGIRCEACGLPRAEGSWKRS